MNCLGTEKSQRQNCQQTKLSCGALPNAQVRICIDVNVFSSLLLAEP
jgi:hypothetical protein